MNRSAWRYIGKADPARLAALGQSLPNAELPAALQRGLALKCFHREPRQDDVSFKRAVFCGTVDDQLFDWFFNANTGYRGAYFDSPEFGTRANLALVNHLAYFLAEWALSQELDLDRDWILASLSKTSAKAWLAEYPGLCGLCSGEWGPTYISELQIENSRWENSSHVHSVWGRQAPRLSKIRIFGGFIDSVQNEWLATHKTERARHIWEHGWT